MDIQTEKLELMRLLIDTESEEVINELKSVFIKKGYDFWDDLPDNVKENIAISLKQVEEGKLLDHHSVMRDIRAQYGLES